MTTFEFPDNAITYFYFVPDLYDRIIVEQTKGEKVLHLAAIAIDGYIQLTPSGEQSTGYQYVKEFKPQLVRFSEQAYVRLAKLVEGMDAPFDPLNAVCMGVMRTQGTGGIIPFLATDEKTNVPTRTDLRARKGADVLMRAISEVTTLFPPTVPPLADRKVIAEAKGEIVAAMPISKTKMLHALLDRANELPEAQLTALLTIVDAAVAGKYVIKINPGDIRVVSQQTSGGKK